jgi:hypothetical protein
MEKAAVIINTAASVINTRNSLLYNGLRKLNDKIRTFKIDTNRIKIQILKGMVA